MLQDAAVSVSAPRSTLGRPVPDQGRAVLLAVLALLVAVAGLVWAKWLPYADRATGLAAGGHWKGGSLLTAGAGQPTLERAWTFTWTYAQAVWKALLVALVISACVDVLVPRRWLLKVLGGRAPLAGSMVGGLAALPGMMCTCCTAPLAITMRRAGVPVSAALAFWLGNPVLNPAVLVFLGLLAPWPWVVVRIVLGVALVVGVSALIGHLVTRRQRVRAADLPAVAMRAMNDAVADPPVTWAALPGRLVRSVARLAIVLVPEYLLVVFVVGLVGEPLGRVLGAGGALAVLVAAAVGTLLVLPTGGEVPILLGLAAAGASAGVLGALLLALPALSLPSAVMVGRAMGWRVTAAAASGTVVVAVLAGGVLSVL